MEKRAANLGVSNMISKTDLWEAVEEHMHVFYPMSMCKY